MVSNPVAVLLSSKVGHWITIALRTEYEEQAGSFIGDIFTQASSLSIFTVSRQRVYMDWAKNKIEAIMNVFLLTL